MPRLSPLKAIRAYCIDCSGGSAKEVRLCVIPDCPLYCYRMGKTGRKGHSNPKGAEALAAHRRKKSASADHDSDAGGAVQDKGQECPLAWPAS